MPLLYAADADNWQDMAALAKKNKVPLAVRAQSLDELAQLTEQIQAAGVEDLVLDHGAPQLLAILWRRMTQLRRLALKNGARNLGFPIITFPGEGVENTNDEASLAAQQIAKYAGFVVLDQFSPSLAYALLVLRQNIFTDPQKPIQVQPGLYEINNPAPDSPLMVTTNFSITYFSVANEVDSSGMPGWLLVADAEGMSVLTAWAAGKFDARTIAKGVKRPVWPTRSAIAASSSPARWLFSRANWKRNCPAGKSWSASRGGGSAGLPEGMAEVRLPGSRIWFLSDSRFVISSTEIAHHDYLFRTIPSDACDRRCTCRDVAARGGAAGWAGAERTLRRSRTLRSLCGDCREWPGSAPLQPALSPPIWRVAMPGLPDGGRG